MMATVNNNVYLKVVKRIYLKSSHHIEENINESNCGNHLIYIYIIYQMIMLYSLKLYNVICQLN